MGQGKQSGTNGELSRVTGLSKKQPKQAAFLVLTFYNKMVIWYKFIEMKKTIVFLAFMLSAVVAFAQDAYEVTINYIPERIEILPGVYEFMGKIAGGADVGKDSYALSVNEDLVNPLVDSLTKGAPQILYGPRLEKLVQKKIIEDYRQKRLGIELDLQKEIAEAKGDSTIDVKSLKAELASERKITKNAMKRLQEIVERYNVRAIYVYGRGSVKGSQSQYHSEQEFTNTDPIPIPQPKPKQAPPTKPTTPSDQPDE